LYEINDATGARSPTIDFLAPQIGAESKIFFHSVSILYLVSGSGFSQEMAALLRMVR